MAVCEFCKTTVLKDADSVRDLGKMSEVLEDYTPFQIGTNGSFAQKPFTLIGRIQLRYSAGFWNEWYALFDDGSAGWLSDSSGMYVFTFERAANSALPLFEKLSPGVPVTLFGDTYITSEVRSAECTGGQGELPFTVGHGWQARLADLRTGDHFLSLDYSQGATPTAFVGRSVSLADLKLQLTRDPAQITDAAGRFRGKVSALDCPSCGSPVHCAVGVTVHIVCPNCHAEVDTSGKTAAVLAAGASVAAQGFTLALGSTGNIEGGSYTVLGAMRRAEINGEFSWNEYLLYAPARDFIWLVETGEGWSRASVLNNWPRWDGSGHAELGGHGFTRDSDYVARVAYAAGSFNWRVSVGDSVRVTEFASPAMRLAAELTPEELTWSASRPVALDQVRAWFGEHVHVEVAPHPAYMSTAKHVMIFLIIANFIPLMFDAGSTFTYVLFATAAILLPAWILDHLGEKPA